MQRWLFALAMICIMATLAIATPPEKPARAPRDNTISKPLFHPTAGDRLDLVFESFEDGVPPADWTIMSTGEAGTWVQATGEAHSGNASAAVFYGPTGAWQDEWLVTPALNTQGLGALILQFWEAEAYWADWGYVHSVMVSTTVPDDPAAFTQVVAWTPGDHVIDSWNTPLDVDLSAYVGQDNVYIAFRYEGEYADDWYIDDVWVYEPSDHDVRAVGITPDDTILQAGVPVAPVFTVKNIGQNTETFPVNLTIAQGGMVVYDESASVGDLAPNTAVDVTFPDFTPEAGYIYTLTGTTQLEGDEEPGNDMTTATVECFSGQRMPLGLLVTNWDCGPCVQANVFLDDYYPAHSDEIALIRVHCWWPGDDDPLYLANPEQAEFLVEGTPTGSDYAPHLWIDNVVDCTHDAAVFAGFFEAQLQVAAPLELSLQYAQGSSFALVTVDVLDPLNPEQDYALYVAVTEDHVEALGSNGEQFHNQAFRMLYPDLAGLPVPQDPGQYVYQVDLPLNVEWVFDNLRATAYVQNLATGMVQNAGSMFLHEGSVAIEDPQLPDDTVPALATNLAGAHPNPFNPQTDIKFSLAREEQVRLAVYDLEGRRVAELADGVFPAGEHSLHWNGQDQAGRELPSGIYMVQMVTERTVRSSKMTLVR